MSRATGWMASGLFLGFILLQTLSLISTGGVVWGGEREAFLSREVVYARKEYMLKGYLSRPEGAGPFPAVVYNHGGLGDKIGGCPRETSEALARAGYVGFSPLRRPTVPMSGHLDDLLDALNYVKGLEYVNKDRIALMGFSRGGHLTLVAGAVRRDLKAIVIMAAAPGRGGPRQFLANAARVSSPLLLMVAENDNVQEDHVALMKQVKRALDEGGKDSELILYPPYQSDGHRMFFEIGLYWADVLRFLGKTLK